MSLESFAILYVVVGVVVYLLIAFAASADRHEDILDVGCYAVLTGLFWLPMLVITAGMVVVAGVPWLIRHYVWRLR